MSLRRVVVTGLGVVAPVGQTVNQFFAGLVTGRSGIRPVRPLTFPGTHSLVAGEIDFDASVH